MISNKPYVRANIMIYNPSLSVPKRQMIWPEFILCDKHLSAYSLCLAKTQAWAAFTKDSAPLTLVIGMLILIPSSSTVRFNNPFYRKSIYLKLSDAAAAVTAVLVTHRSVAKHLGNRYPHCWKTRRKCYRWFGVGPWSY